MCRPVRRGDRSLSPRPRDGRLGGGRSALRRRVAGSRSSSRCARRSGRERIAGREHRSTRRILQRPSGERCRNRPGSRSGLRVVARGQIRPTCLAGRLPHDHGPRFRGLLGRASCANLAVRRYPAQICSAIRARVPGNHLWVCGGGPTSTHGGVRPKHGSPAGVDGALRDGLHRAGRRRLEPGGHHARVRGQGRARWASPACTPSDTSYPRPCSEWRRV